MKVYFFGWPGRIGGADTKLAHLLPLLRPEFDLTIVPALGRDHLDSAGKQQLEALGIPCALLTELPERLTGWGVSLCNAEFLSTGAASEARRRGLRLAWSNEMMCLFSAERGALILGLIDAVLYVSEAQRHALEPQYQRILSGGSQLVPLTPEPACPEGWIDGGSSGRKLRWVMTGNYIDSREFPFVRRTPVGPGRRPLIVGRLSRPDPAKFPPHFPSFYESLGLRHARFRVMAWDGQVRLQWPEHVFDDRWELLPALAESTVQFLQSLDLFVYSLHPRCRESWGRAVVEAMLCGAIPLVPAGAEHHLQKLVTHGQSGYVCADDAEFGRWARQLERDDPLRDEMSARAHSLAVQQFCNPKPHLESWRRLFYGAPFA